MMEAVSNYAQHYIVKPVEMNSLAAQIDYVLSLPGGRIDWVLEVIFHLIHLWSSEFKSQRKDGILMIISLLQLSELLSYYKMCKLRKGKRSVVEKINHSSLSTYGALAPFSLPQGFIPGRESESPLEQARHISAGPIHQKRCHCGHKMSHSHW